MARQVRIEYAGAAYHVMGRGNQGWAIYADDRDQKRWLKTFANRPVCGLAKLIERLEKTEKEANSFANE